MNKEKLTELVYINLGRASMCWSDIPSGVFDSTKAAELGKEIMEAVEKYVEAQEETPGWSDPMTEMLDREEKESEWQRRRRLDVMKEARMNPNPAHYESREITIEDIHKIHKEMMDKEEGLISTSDNTTEWTTEVRNGITIHQSKPNKDI